ncbi:MAG: exodeoxyribonuclease VII small subunit [Gammaproteobacteria bacterium]|nr:exodeoxyribonuclease VII small subunit [Gammaproteobacteria bacterium]MDD9807496.1 exodeoxyribonuclease VII small subunit [Gammaproteobacteria bacterium]MDD9869491.1 exodeoxyribonuclease VII small subunit [Gammaproteobacteria bacterium]MDD9886830.1 exodeoxyribonuclease VII small subunit [Gammaproteobacteria bacterium]
MAQTKNRAKKSAPDFEKAIGQLEEIVARLEGGDLTLEQALEQFERGVALAKDCRDALARAEQRVKVLTKKEAREILEDDDEDGDEDGGG